jgi:hypothetical protein
LSDSILYQTEMVGKSARLQRDRESVCVCVCEAAHGGKGEIASVIK